MRLTRAIMLLATIGGGFTGFMVTLGVLLQATTISPGQVLIFVIVLSLYAYITWVGLKLAEDNQSQISESTADHLKRAFVLQIPFISSPLIHYKMSSGFNFTTILHGEGASWFWNLGSQFQLNFLTGDKWAIGVNFAAIILFWMAFIEGNKAAVLEHEETDELIEPVTELNSDNEEIKPGAPS